MSLYSICILYTDNQFSDLFLYNNKLHTIAAKDKQSKVPQHQVDSTHFNPKQLLRGLVCWENFAVSIEVQWTIGKAVLSLPVYFLSVRSSLFEHLLDLLAGVFELMHHDPYSVTAPTVCKDIFN